ncbi:MAG: hypothetical protein GY694_08120 [Gammaproteobacteria bacterium]|nr:hypothetical protein [Gammaproteobacteria bacterium]
MSQNISIIAVRKKGLRITDLATYLGLEDVTEETSFENATSHMFEDTAFSEVGDWIIGIDGEFWQRKGGIINTLAELGAGSEAIYVISQGTSSQYMYEHQQNGIVLRRLYISECEVVKEAGDKTSFELVIDDGDNMMLSDGEDYLFRILQNAGISTIDCMQLKFKIFRSNLQQNKIARKQATNSSPNFIKKIINIFK